MFKLKLMIPALIGLTMAVGCGSADTAAGTTTTGSTPEVKKPSSPMTGDWKLVLDAEAVKKAPPGAKMPEMIMTFKDDNTFEVNMKIETTSSTAAGTYKLDGKALTLDTLTEDGKESKSPDQTVTLADDMKSFDVPGAQGMGKIVKQ